MKLKNYYEATDTVKKIETIDYLLIGIETKNGNILIEELKEILDEDKQEAVFKCIKNCLNKQLEKEKSNLENIK